MPQSRREYWAEKFERNRARDIDVRKRLKRLGWTIHVIWECALRDDERWLAAFQKVAGLPHATTVTSRQNN